MTQGRFFKSSLLMFTCLAAIGCSESDEQNMQGSANQGSGNLGNHNRYSHTHVRGNGEIIRGSGKVRQESRELEEFTAIEVKMGADVKIVRASEPSVVVIADDNLQPIMSTEVVGGTLTITTKHSFATNNKITFVVAVPVIKRILVEGSGGMFLENVTQDDLQLTINGSGDVGGIGTVETFNARIDGSGDLLLERLKSKKCSVNVNGSGDAAVYASESLSAVINGSGSISYSGNPKDVHRRVNGSGEIRAKR